MEAIDVLVLRTVNEWRQSNYHVLLVTVLRTWGSSPRPVGAMMAIREDGRVVGSVSGGCIEDDLIRLYSKPGALKAKAGHVSELMKYGVTAEEAHQFGLPCGGTIELLLEYDPDPDVFTHLLNAIDGGRLMMRKIHVQTGKQEIHETASHEEFSFDGEWLRLGFGPNYRMLLIGAGQLSEYLASMALFNGFDVTVCDPRKQYLDSWSLDKVHLVRGMPDDEVVAFKLNANSCVIALTHDPKLDDLALLEALESPAFYVGAIGSRKNSNARRTRMIEYLDQTEESLRALRSPVGVYIGSKTPAEIAVSIMAEVIAVKNGVTLPISACVAEAKNTIEETT